MLDASRRRGALRLLLCSVVATAGCGPSSENLQAAHAAELRTLDRLRSEKRELEEHYQATLDQVAETRQELMKVQQQRIDLRKGKSIGPDIDDMQAYERQLDTDLAPQLASVRAKYDAAIKDIDAKIVGQERRVEQAKAAAGL